MAFLLLAYTKFGLGLRSGKVLYGGRKRRLKPRHGRGTVLDRWWAMLMAASAATAY
jgi:hypothetical protein